MWSILAGQTISKLSVAESQTDLDLFMQPVLRRLPEQRLRSVATLTLQLTLGGHSPLLTRMARGVVCEEETIWPTAKRFYRFVGNGGFSHRDLLKTLYVMPLPFRFRVAFTHARKARHVDYELGSWLMIRLPETHQVLWVLVVDYPDYDRDLVLLNNIPIPTAAQAQAAYI